MADKSAPPPFREATPAALREAWKSVSPASASAFVTPLGPWSPYVVRVSRPLVEAAVFLEGPGTDPGIVVDAMAERALARRFDPAAAGGRDDAFA